MKNETMSCESSADSTVLLGFLDQVKLNPTKVALVEEGGRVSTYHELSRLSNAWSGYLASVGVQRGDVVAISLERSIEMIAALLGIVRLGAVYLAIDPNCPDDRKNYQCQDAGVKFHITTPELSSPKLAMPEEEFEVIANDNEDFYVVYTSGSTGKPKGVPTTHQAFRNLLAWFCSYYQLTATTKTALVVNEGFDAFGWQLWPYLARGATIYLVKKSTFLAIDDFISLLNRELIDICFVPTAYVEILINNNQLDTISSLKYLLTGGDKLISFLPKHYPFRLINHYGVSEGAVVSTFGEVTTREEAIAHGAGGNCPSIGKPIDHIQAYVMDNQGLPVTNGAWGELVIGGVGVARGYLNDPELSARKFRYTNHDDQTRLYFTGDRVRWLSDGSIEFRDRLDDQIELHGYRIEPSEIEQAIAEYPSVNQVAVVLHHSEFSKQLIAYLTLQHDAPRDFDMAKVLAELRKKLPDAMIPSHLIVLDQFPITDNGKIDRNSLVQRKLLEHSENPGEQQGSENLQQFQEVVVAVFSELLNIPPENIDLDRSFFELGGDSIGLLRLLNNLKKRLGIVVPLAEMYHDQGSVRSLVAILARRQLA